MDEIHYFPQTSFEQFCFTTNYIDGFYHNFHHPIANFPTKYFLGICAFLNLDELFSLRLVSKQWQKKLKFEILPKEDEALWKKIYQNQWEKSFSRTVMKFSDLEFESRTISWKTLCQKMWKSKLETSSLQSESFKFVQFPLFCVYNTFDSSISTTPNFEKAIQIRQIFSVFGHQVRLKWEFIFEEKHAEEVDEWEREDKETLELIEWNTEELRVELLRCVLKQWKDRDQKNSRLWSFPLHQVTKEITSLLENNNFAILLRDLGFHLRLYSFD